MGLSADADIVVRDVEGDAILFAWPLKVIEDSDRGLITSQVPGAVGKVTKGYPEDPEQVIEGLLSGHPTLVDLAWTRTTTVGVLTEGQWWCTRLMWDATSGDFMCCYVDFLRPIRRHGHFVDTLDLALDLVALPDGSWFWKDEDHLPLVRAAGWLPPEDEAEVDAARSVVVGLVEERRFPFDGSLLHLRPDPSSTPAVLPSDWDRI